jgi:hypothetical protein
MNPYAFTEHGTIMLANVLNTPTACSSPAAAINSRYRIEPRWSGATAG